MKRHGHLFEKITSYENLFCAFKKAFKGAGKTAEACAFHFALEPELLKLKEELVQGTYNPRPYHYFKIYDPKERTISVAPFRDRVVHHAVVGVLEDIYEPCFIFDSYATRKGKGTHKALARARRFLKKNGYYLKTDVAKYFDSADHGILSDLLKRKIKDRKTLDLVRRIISNSDQSRGQRCGRGLPIGNLTSQFFANVYLNPLDHYIKDELGIKYYIRYMDDMVVFSESKEELKKVLAKMKTFLLEKLDLALHANVTAINHRIHGLPFLGFRVFPNLVRIKPENLKRIKKRWQKRETDFLNGRINETQLADCVRAMWAHMDHADSYGLRRQMTALKAGN